MNPYKTLGETAFWSPAVGQRHMFDMSGLWTAKFPIDRKTSTVTFGSCFAQHFSRALVARGFSWSDKETPPDGLGEADRRRFNYGVFSARTGNIYTVSLLLQWVRWALGEDTPPEEVWEKDGRFFDPFRPNIEPGGFASAEEMLRSRAACIEAFRRCITEPRMFVFTMGLTESWWHGAERDYEYPMCPGTVAGDFDPDTHVFLNQDYSMVLARLTEALRLMRAANRRLRVLLTVSPVPLTATMSGNHVLVATMESKSILRAAAARAAKKFGFVDYFPSYEIINSAPFRGVFFEPNMRSVNRNGVDHVMKTFFAGLPEGGDAAAGAAAEPDAEPAAGTRRRAARRRARAEADLVCEEELLEAVGRGSGGAS